MCLSVLTSQLIMSALTSAKTNGASYIKCVSPLRMALTEVGPQQNTPAEMATSVYLNLDMNLQRQLSPFP